ncbi:MAG: NAD-dependent epimerase/dehydratase family protein, partial [Saprospiraceae bacterium]|nr:NAD-dependent epimerase/dehydratase family protein [Saprospiraceae bacterium]
MNQKLNVIITGATGMVGEGVMHQCLQNEHVASVLLINRKPYGLKHPKLTEVIHQDFYDLSSIESKLKGYNACFFCLGISSVGISKEEYFKITYTLTLHMGETLSRLNPDMVFTYVSGMGTDSKEKGNGWASVKGKTENDLKKLPFKKVHAYR